MVQALGREAVGANLSSVGKGLNASQGCIPAEASTTIRQFRAVGGNTDGVAQRSGYVLGAITGRD